jgi:hypothetical protein
MVAVIMILNEICVSSKETSVLISIIEPIKNDIIPPAARSPWLTILISAIKRIKANKMRANPAKFSGSELRE